MFTGICFKDTERTKFCIIASMLCQRNMEPFGVRVKTLPIHQTMDFYPDPKYLLTPIARKPPHGSTAGNHCSLHRASLFPRGRKMALRTVISSGIGTSTGSHFLTTTLAVSQRAPA
jgi:hypothetical protein